MNFSMRTNRTYSLIDRDCSVNLRGYLPSADVSAVGTTGVVTLGI